MTKAHSPKICALLGCTANAKSHKKVWGTHAKSVPPSILEHRRWLLKKNSKIVCQKHYNVLWDTVKRFPFDGQGTDQFKVRCFSGDSKLIELYTLKSLKIMPSDDAVSSSSTVETNKEIQPMNHDINDSCDDTQLIDRTPELSQSDEHHHASTVSAESGIGNKRSNDDFSDQHHIKRSRIEPAYPLLSPQARKEYAPEVEPQNTHDKQQTQKTNTSIQLFPPHQLFLPSHDIDEITETRQTVVTCTVVVSVTVKTHERCLARVEPQC